MITTNLDLEREIAIKYMEMGYMSSSYRCVCI